MIFASLCMVILVSTSSLPSDSASATSDTLYAFTLLEEPSPGIMSFASGFKLLKMCYIVQHDYTESSLSSSERILGASIVIEIDTVEVMTRMLPQEQLNQTEFSSESAGHTHLDTIDSFSLLIGSSGYIDRAVSAQAISKDFYIEQVLMSPDDFPAEIEALTARSPDSSFSTVELTKSITLIEFMDISSRWWNTLNLPGSARVWGSSSPSETIREAILVRTTTSIMSANSSILYSQQPIIWTALIPKQISDRLYSDNPGSVVSFFSDTLIHSQEGYLFVSDDSTVAESGSIAGWIYYVPYCGPLLDSLVIGRLPSLGEFGVTAFEIGSTYAFGKVVVPAGQRAIAFLNRVIAPRTAYSALSATDHRTLLRAGLFSNGFISSGQDAHHIVALTDPRFSVARQTLNRLGIGIDDVVNGVGLDEAFHARLHTNRYAYEVSSRIVRATTSQQAQEILTWIRQGLLSGDFPY